MGHTFFKRNDTYKRLNKLDPKFKSQKDLEEGTSPLKQDLSNEDLNQEQASPSSQRPQRPQRPQSSAYEQELEQRYREVQRQKLEEKLRLQAEAAAKGEEYIIETEESPKPRRKVKDPEKEERRKSKVPKALYDPEVRKQLEELKQHKPFFMYTVTILQIILMIVSLGVNYAYTGHVFDNLHNNIYFGPNIGTIIHMGARYVPCMKELTYSDPKKNFNVTICPQGIAGSIVNTDICSLGDLCGMGGIEEGKAPNQWIRFILPIFLHAGIIHIFINLIFQIRTGIQMEKDFGTWRMMIIYMASGIFGFAFGADISYNVPSVGCSGALYGLLGCLLLDLIQNWKLIVNPWKELIKMLIIIIFSLGIGLLRFIDNFAHFGGFITGILTGLIFMPTIIFGKWDLRRKRFLMIISIPILIFMFIWVFKSFYKEGDSKCTWCKYVTCVPIGEWCKDL
ncbi:rhomboid-domain-containing protein [Anaeromyces robustus]|uniref:Rhomboid-type serine protease n=1 Tax=Anaeromyces robustus TaxID=1754192 RepID=A0A1Y1X398_9FUNG|nr:rhomboid-domain-containing protein [Anaeromyces robustus]|eukprot:ORX80108.1 rhomboid-domain-containing protein [Anaeromyces robustus]